MTKYILLHINTHILKQFIIYNELILLLLLFMPKSIIYRLRIKDFFSGFTFH
jgi:hypothetical protein